MKRTQAPWQAVDLQGEVEIRRRPPQRAGARRPAAPRRSRSGPPLLFLLSGRLGEPVVWVRPTVASVGAQRQTGNNTTPLRRSISFSPLFARTSLKLACGFRFKIYHYRTYHMGPVVSCSFRFKITVLDYHEKKHKQGLLSIFWAQDLKFSLYFNVFFTILTCIAL